MLRAGDIIGVYQLERSFETGGMALVWQVQNMVLRRQEALKHPRLELLKDTTTLLRFADETRIAASLSHPGIVTIYNIGTHSLLDGRNVPYFAMEFLYGGSLSGLLRERGRLTIAETAALLAPVADALDHAHRQGIVHRDLKPGNLMFVAAAETGATPLLKVTDFGLAKALDAGDGRTATGFAIGTPRYMSPEQCGSGEPIGPASDQYALTILAYEMLTGTTPFRPTDASYEITVLAMHRVDSPPDPRTHVPDLPEEAAMALLRGLAKEGGQRFPNCAALITALSAAAFTASPLTIPLSVPTSADPVYRGEKATYPPVPAPSAPDAVDPLFLEMQLAESGEGRNSAVLPFPLPPSDATRRHIWEELRDAEPGATLFFPPGLYDAFEITKPLSLWFEDGAHVTWESHYPVVRVRLENPEDRVEIHGLTVRHATPKEPTTGPLPFPCALHIERGQVALLDCRVESADGYAVWAGPMEYRSDPGRVPLSFTGTLEMRRCRVSAPGSIGVTLFALGDVPEEPCLFLSDTVFEACRYGAVVPYRGQIEATGLLFKRCTGIGMVLGRSSARVEVIGFDGNAHGVWDRFGIATPDSVAPSPILIGPGAVPEVSGYTDWYSPIFALVETPETARRLGQRFARRVPALPIFLRQGQYRMLTINQPYTLVADAGAIINSCSVELGDLTETGVSGASLHGLSIQARRLSQGGNFHGVYLESGAVALFDCEVHAEKHAVYAVSGKFSAVRSRFSSESNAALRFLGRIPVGSADLPGSGSYAYLDPNRPPLRVELTACRVEGSPKEGIEAAGERAEVFLYDSEITRCATGLSTRFGAIVHMSGGAVRFCTVGIDSGDVDDAGDVRMTGVTLSENRENVRGNVTGA